VMDRLNNETVQHKIPSMNKLADSVTPGSEDDQLLQQLNLDQLPRHVAIIMDGNGRWAKDRKLPRVAGHRAGINAVRDAVETSARLGLEVLTLYAFSLENWKRPRTEISVLMKLLQEYVHKELDRMNKNNIKIRAIGQLSDLPASARKELELAAEATRDNTGMQFNIALSYGGRTEIVEACKSIMKSGVDPDTLDIETFSSHLYTAGQPDPDLLIRTSGELRISNFLLWQIAYAEIWVTPVRWPDFRCRHLLQACVEFQQRERRYGGLAPEKTTGPRANVRS
jgi:undecaprenyl diphosphate synthase